MDIALSPTANGGLDFAIAGGDLATDDGLFTAVWLSLATDRLAEADDVLPDGLPAAQGDRRGWWGDWLLSDELGVTDNWGSRFWLLARAKQTAATLAAAQLYGQEALAWMVEDDVAESVTVTAAWTALGAMAVTIAIMQDGTNRIWQLLWSATAGFTVPQLVNLQTGWPSA